MVVKDTLLYIGQSSGSNYSIIQMHSAIDQNIASVLSVWSCSVLLTKH
jgi:hypothetical protein